MTFPCKEEVIWFEQQPREMRRYSREWLDECRFNLRQICEFYGGTKERWQGGGRVDVFIPIEHDEGQMLAGLVLTVQVWRDRASIQFQRLLLRPATARASYHCKVA